MASAMPTVAKVEASSLADHVVETFSDTDVQLPHLWLRGRNA
jgi:hypothetical protein